MIGLCHVCWSSGVEIKLSKTDEPICDKCEVILK